MCVWNYVTSQQVHYKWTQLDSSWDPRGIRERSCRPDFIKSLQCFVLIFRRTAKEGLKDLRMHLSPVMPMTAEQFDGSELKLFLSKLGLGRGGQQCSRQRLNPKRIRQSDTVSARLNPIAVGPFSWISGDVWVWHRIIEHMLHIVAVCFTEQHNATYQILKAVGNCVHPGASLSQLRVDCRAISARLWCTSFLGFNRGGAMLSAHLSSTSAVMRTMALSSMTFHDGYL